MPLLLRLMAAAMALALPIAVPGPIEAQTAPPAKPAAKPAAKPPAAARTMKSPPALPGPSTLPNARESDGTTVNPDPRDIAQVPETLAPPRGPAATEPQARTVNRGAPSPGSGTGDAGSTPLR